MFPSRILALLAGVFLASLGADRLFGQIGTPPAAVWPHVGSDLKPDPAIRFGTLPNGMRYELRRNATPPKQVSLRMRIDAGSLMEKDDQRGLAHFMEHMAFNGTTHLPENEMIATLQRHGLGFGSDTNAITSFNETVYKLDVPSATDESLDAALNIMREQVSEALMASKDIDEERGVIAGEQRTRDGPGYRTEVARLKLISAWLGSRLPIGSMDVIRTAGRDRFIDFYRTYYRPSRATLVAVGDFDIYAMERRIRTRFADWAPKAPDVPDPAPPPPASRGIETKIIIEPGSERTVELIWTRPADLRPDSAAKQYDNASNYVGISALNQRLQEIANGDAPPFVTALAKKDDLYRTLDVTSIKVTFLPGRLREAVTAIEREQRRLIAHGVTAAELARIVDDGRSYMRRGVAGAATQSTPQLANELAAQVNNREVPLSWPDRQALFERQVRAMTPASVTKSIRGAFVGADPLVLVTTPVPLPGGEAAVSRELAAARKLPTPPPPPPEVRTWPYTSFGKSGTVVGRRDIPEIGTTVVTFANGTLLTVKPTRFADKDVAVSVTAGTGQLGMTRDRMDPLYGAKSYLVNGGLGKLTRDQISRVLAGRSVGAEGSVEQDRYKWKGTTQTDELPTELQLLAAYVADPGLRPAPLEREKATLATTVETFRATPYGAWQLDSPGLLSSGDAREAIPANAELQKLSMATAAPLMRKAIGSGPIHVTIVGDVTVDQAIADTAATFGALAPRGPAATPLPGADIRRFPAGGATVRLHHTGPADRAFAVVAWPGPSGVKDNAELLRAQMLTFVLNDRINKEIRERQALAYSPSALIRSSTVFEDAGYIGGVGEVKAPDVPAFFAAMDAIASDLRETPITQDELDRAKRPLIAQLNNRINTNDFWLESLRDVDIRPDRVGQITQAIPTIQAVTVADIQSLARTYLVMNRVWRASVTAKPVEPVVTKHGHY